MTKEPKKQRGKIPRGMTTYDVRDGVIHFMNDNDTIGTGLQGTHLTHIGSYSIDLLKQAIELAGDADTVKIYVDTEKDELGPCKIGEYWVAPLISTPDVSVLVKKRKR